MEKCVSVVIPSYNRAHLLRTTIPSYIQEYVGEVIIVDDCSSDNTTEVVRELQKKYPLIKYIRMDQNSKQTAAKNRGVIEAIYPYIYLGDDDSFITENTIGELLNSMYKFNADIVGAKALYMDSAEDMNDVSSFIIRKSRAVKSISEALDINKLFYINFDFDCNGIEKVPFCHACALVKKEIFNNIQFDTSYRGNAFREETDFFTRASASGRSIYYNSKAIQINLPRNLVINKNSLVKFKIKSSYYEFLNTYKYLHKNIKFIREYYSLSSSAKAIWLNYMKDALSVKIMKLGKVLGSSK